MFSKTSKVGLETKTEPNETKPQNYDVDVVIVGAGVAGLTAALEAMHAGLRVLLIEYRSEKNSATRPQLVYAPETTSYLTSKKTLPTDLNLKDLELLEKIKQEASYYFHQDYYGIKDFQDFLKNRIGHLNPELCTILYESSVTKINLEQGSLSFCNVQDNTITSNVKFKHIVLADGGKHQTANLIPDFEFKPSEKVQRPQNKYAAAYLTVSSNTGGPINKANLEFPDNVIKLFDGKYTGIIHPEFYSTVKSGRKKLKLYIVMSVSDERYELFKSNREWGIEYLSHCVADVFNKNDYYIKMTESKNPQKDKLKFTTFTQEFIEANQAAINKNEHIAALIGDTLYHPDFNIGQGTSFATLTAVEAIKLITGKTKVSEYNNWNKNYLKTRKKLTKENVEDELQEFLLLQQSKHKIPGLVLVSPFESDQLETAIKDAIKMHVFGHPVHSFSSENELMPELTEEELLFKEKIQKMLDTLNKLANTLKNSFLIQNELNRMTLQPLRHKSEN